MHAMHAAPTPPDAVDEMLQAGASPWIRAGGGFVLGAGLVAVGVALQAVVMGIYLSTLAWGLVSLVGVAGLASIPCGFGILQKRAGLAAAAIGCAGVLFVLAVAWAVLLVANGNVSLLAMGLVPLSGIGLGAAALAHGPVQRFARAAQAAAGP
jgi:hypothetical protein